MSTYVKPKCDRVSLKHDWTDGTVKMANLPVPSVCDRRDRLSRLCVTDGTGRRLVKHDGTVKMADKPVCPVVVWQMPQIILHKSNPHAAMVQSQHWYNDNINSYTSVLASVLTATKIYCNILQTVILKLRLKITDTYIITILYYHSIDLMTISIHWNRFTDSQLTFFIVLIHPNTRNCSLQF